MQKKLEELGAHSLCAPLFLEERPWTDAVAAWQPVLFIGIERVCTRVLAPRTRTGVPSPLRTASDMIPQILQQRDLPALPPSAMPPAAIPSPTPSPSATDGTIPAVKTLQELNGATPSPSPSPDDSAAEEPAGGDEERRAAARARIQARKAQRVAAAKAEAQTESKTADPGECSQTFEMLCPGQSFIYALDRIRVYVLGLDFQFLEARPAWNHVECGCCS